MRKLLIVIVTFCSPLLRNGGEAYAQFTVAATPTNGTCATDSTGSVTLILSNGTPPYTYKWSPGGQTTSSLPAITSGIYSVTVTDNTGSSSTASCIVGPAPILNDSADHFQNPICTNNGYVDLVVSGGTGAHQYLWNTGSTDDKILDLSAGDYSVVVTDANSCSAAFSFQLIQGKCFVSAQSFFSPNGDDINDTWQIANSQYFPDARVIVFNRWGTKVYEHRGLYEPWDGRSYLGIPVPDAVYYYFIYQDKEETKKEAIEHTRGSVTIIR